MGRRAVLHLALGALAGRAFGCASTRPITIETPPRGNLDGGVSLWSWFDLPTDPRSCELSGIAWDEETRTLWAVQDDSRNIVALRPDRDLRSWGFVGSVPIDIGGPLDLEGIVVTKEGFIVCSEEGPRVVELGRDGRMRAEIRLPARFKDARQNKSLESLALSPTGQFLFTTSESALERDGPLANTRYGARVRILRIERDKGEVSEHAYVTDPASSDSGDYGVADLAALGDEELLVLERGWAKGHGNTVRVYAVSLDEESSCLGTSELREGGPVLTKRLVVDLAKLPAAAGLPRPKQPQASPLLDNFEGLALGPLLPDGRRTLILVSDDNARRDQVARILVLALGKPCGARRASPP